MKLQICITELKSCLTTLMLFLIIGNINAQETVDSTRIKRPMPKIVEEQTEKAEKEWLKLWNEGPTKLIWDKIPLQEGNEAPDFELES